MRLAKKVFKKAAKGWRVISTRPQGEVQQNELENLSVPIKVSPIISPISIPVQLPVEVDINKEEREKEKTEYEIEGIKIPRQLKIVPTPPKTFEHESFSLNYPLVPRNPKPGEKVFAEVKIYWDKRRQSYFYELVEPKLDEKTKETFDKIKELIEHRLDVDLSKLNLIKAKEYLKIQLDEVIKYFKFQLSEEQLEKIRYYLERDF